MANQKVFVCGGEGNEAKFLSVQRVSDDLYLQSSDGSFGASISHIPMDAAMDDGGAYVGYYEHVEDREVWQDGYYRVTMGPSTGTGIHAGISAYRVRVVGDTLMEGAALTSLAARNAAAGLSGGITDLGAAVAVLTKKVGVLDSKVDTLTISLARR